MMNKQPLLRYLSILLLITTSLLVVSCAGGPTLEQDLELNLKFGNSMAKMGLWKEAILRWQNGLKINPNDARLHNNLGIAYENEGDYEKAKHHYKRARQLDPSNESIKLNAQNFDSTMILLDEWKKEAKE